MTTGSWSTMSTVSGIAGYCSSNSQLTNGMLVSWSGPDSPMPRKLKAKYRYRDISFFDPAYKPYRKLLKSDPTDLPAYQAFMAEVFTSKEDNIFDHAASKRLRVAEDPVGTIAAQNAAYRPPHAFSKEWQQRKEYMFPMYDGSGNWLTNQACVQNCGLGAQTPPDPWTVEHDYKLLERLRSKVVGSEFNLASFLGAEGHDTLKLITDTSNRIYQSFRALRRGSVADSVRVLRGTRRTPNRKAPQDIERQLDVYRDLREIWMGDSKRRPPATGWAGVFDKFVTAPAELWLTWHLAVEPLIGDLNAAAEQLAHITSVPRQRRYRVGVTARARAEPSALSPSWAINQRLHRKSYTCYFRYEPEPMAFMGFQDPEVTIWNAIPLSFVSDYFFDVGSWLSARAIASHLPSGTYILSDKDETYYRNLLGQFGTNPPSLRRVVTDGRDLFARTGKFVRSLPIGISVPPPTFKPLGVFENWQRAVTTASLAAVFSTRATDAWAKAHPGK